MITSPFENNIKQQTGYGGRTMKKITYIVLIISFLLASYFTWCMSEIHYAMKEELERKDREIAGLEDEIYLHGMELTKCRLGGKWPHMSTDSSQKQRSHPYTIVEVIPTAGEVR
jgi:hypothetical protein